MPYSNISFTINTGLSFEVNDFVKLVHDASTAIYGRVVSYNPSTGALVLTPYSFSGTSGSYNTWAVDLTGVSGTSGVSATSGTSGISSTSGNNGTNGTSGVSGSSGTSGTSAIGIADSGTSGTCLTFPLPVTSTGTQTFRLNNTSSTSVNVSISFDGITVISTQTCLGNTITTFTPNPKTFNTSTTTFIELFVSGYNPSTADLYFNTTNHAPNAYGNPITWYSVDTTSITTSIDLTINP